MTVSFAPSSKIRLTAAALALLSAGIAGEASAKDRIRLSLVLGATGLEFSGEQRAGAEAAVRDLMRAVPGSNVQLKVSGPAQINPGEEVRIFQSEASTLPDAILVAPIPPSLFTEPALQAQRQGIPLAFLMSPPSQGLTNALFVGQREYDMGRRVANLIVDRVIAKSAPRPAAEITGALVPGICVPGMENLEDRMLGVRDTFRERLPRATVPANINTGNERGRAFATWQQAVQAQPNALAFVGACETDFTNLTKIKEDDRRTFEMVVFDTPEAVRNSIRTGTIAAAVPPSHFTSFYMAVWTVGGALLRDQRVPTGFLETPITVIDPRNIATFDGASLPPAELETFYRRDIDTLKTRDVTRLPPLSAARAPGRG